MLFSFGNSAKSIKNKPVVNEVISDAVFMKRLKKEINRLQAELKEEKLRSNDQVTWLRLQQKILERESQFLKSKKCEKGDKIRRRTWCPTVPYSPYTKTNDDEIMPPPSNIPLPRLAM